MLNELEKFNDLWTSFITALKGTLLNLAQKGELDFGHAKTALAEQSMNWKNEYSAEGRWLKKLIDGDDAQGLLVKKILTNDMQFRELPVRSAGNRGTVVGALGGGAIGFGAATFANFQPVATIATTVVAAAVGGVIGRGSDIRSNDEAIRNAVNGYLSQLDSYYHSVVAALNI